MHKMSVFCSALTQRRLRLISANSNFNCYLKDAGTQTFIEQKKRGRDDGERNTDVSLRNEADNDIGTRDKGNSPPTHHPWLDSELLKPQPYDSALIARSNCPYSSTMSLGMLQKALPSAQPSTVSAPGQRQSPFYSSPQ